jgi:hypothetical protein
MQHNVWRENGSLEEVKSCGRPWKNIHIYCRILESYIAREETEYVSDTIQTLWLNKVTLYMIKRFRHKTILLSA